MRRKTGTVHVGGIPIGGGHPIVVQSMTDTDTADVEATVQQVQLLADAGSEIVRVTVNNADAAKAVPEIKARCQVPLVGDFHFIGHRLLRDHPRCAEALDKFRINPGNELLDLHRDREGPRQARAHRRQRG
jgi:(E)-4-hydroxy-3-methylbut-2-enyl-diphosphate synthase